MPKGTTARSFSKLAILGVVGVVQASRRRQHAEPEAALRLARAQEEVAVLEVMLQPAEREQRPSAGVAEAGTVELEIGEDEGIVEVDDQRLPDRGHELGASRDHDAVGVGDERRQRRFERDPHELDVGVDGGAVLRAPRASRRCSRASVARDLDRANGRAGHEGPRRVGADDEDAAHASWPLVDSLRRSKRRGGCIGLLFAHALRSVKLTVARFSCSRLARHAGDVGDAAGSSGLAARGPYWLGCGSRIRSRPRRTLASSPTSHACGRRWRATPPVPLSEGSRPPALGTSE